jgi:NAD+ diphosphatase
MSRITSPQFKRLVSALKHHKATCTVIESCCGGLINASLLAQPGASAVYWGGSVAYNTKNARPFLLNDADLHDKLSVKIDQSEKNLYIQSKLDWTKKTALAFCQQVGTDFCIAEGGAAGPTFRPQGLDHGFAVVAIAARRGDTVELVRHEVFESSHADREANMRLFADEAAQLALEAVVETRGSLPHDDPPPPAKPRVDRAIHLRSDKAALETMASNAQFIVLHKNMTLFQHNDENQHDRTVAYLSKDQVDSICTQGNFQTETSFLGLVNGEQPVFSIDLLASSDDKDAAKLQTVLDNVFQTERVLLEDTRTTVALLSPLASDLVLHASALAQWQRRNPFCSACGGTNDFIDGGTSTKCNSCGIRQWPRQDPSMIVVVSSRDGQRILLARSPRHPERVHTALAGFVEVGETMESAVEREVFEETGIHIDLDSVNFVTSQPWPFPQSTMIGFTATADDTQTLNIDADELVEASWFTKEQVLPATKIPGATMQPNVAKAAIEANPSLKVLIPPKGVLARTLIDTWLHGGKL